MRAVPRVIVRILPKSESTKTLVESRANKQGLSLMLDGTLREGAHDMSVFGLGFLRSVASVEDYVHVHTGMYHYYGAMESALDSNQSTAGQVWREFPELRRLPGIKQDLVTIGAADDVSAMSGVPPASPATMRYVQRIEAAAAEEGGVRLLGHLYVRYFADLFGGRALGYPTMLAVPDLKTKPEFYAWEDSVEADRRAYIERVYKALNRAGAEMEGDAQRERVVEEARLAFQHNAEVYTEVPGLMQGAARGTFNILKGGIMRSAIQGGSS